MLVHPELGGEDDVLAARTQRAAQELLALAVAVDVSRVEECDSRIQRGMDDGRRGGGVDAATEVVAAESDDRDSQGADGARLHEGLSGFA